MRDHCESVRIQLGIARPRYTRAFRCGEVRRVSHAWAAGAPDPTWGRGSCRSRNLRRRCTTKAEACCCPRGRGGLLLRLLLLLLTHGRWARGRRRRRGPSCRRRRNRCSLCNRRDAGTRKAVRGRGLVAAAAAPGEHGPQAVGADRSARYRATARRCRAGAGRTALKAVLPPREIGRESTCPTAPVERATRFLPTGATARGWSLPTPAPSSTVLPRSLPRAARTHEATSVRAARQQSARAQCL